MMPPQNIERIKQNHHPFPKHPILSGETGAKLARNSFKDLLDASLKHSQGLGRVLRRHDLESGSPQVLGPTIMQSADNLVQMQAGHEKKLEDLAVRVVAGANGIPEKTVRNLFDQAKLSRRGQMGEIDASPPEDDQEIHNTHGERVDRRITHNALIQGAALNHMDKAMTLAKDDLERIHPDLYHEASLFANLSHLGHFHMNPDMLKGMQMPRAGKSEISWDKEGKMKIKARAENFPILVQELSKGIAEANFAHGLPGEEMDEETARRIIEQTDREGDEAWHFMMGPDLEHKLMARLSEHDALIDRGGEFEIPYTRTLLSMIPGNVLHPTLKRILSDNPREQVEAAAELKKHMKQLEELHMRGS